MRLAIAEAGTVARIVVPTISEKTADRRPIIGTRVDLKYGRRDSHKADIYMRISCWFRQHNGLPTDPCRSQRNIVTVTPERTTSTIGQRYLVDCFELEEKTAEPIGVARLRPEERPTPESGEPLESVAGLKEHFGNVGDRTPQRIPAHYASVSRPAAFLEDTLGKLVTVEQKESHSS